MCDPLTIGSLVLTGASYAANASAQSKVESAREDTMAAERIRQQGLDKEAAALSASSQDRFKGFEGKQDQKASKLSDFFNKQNAQQAKTVAEGPTETMPSSQSNIVTQETQNQLGKAKDYADQQGEALGELRSFGDLLGGLSLNTARDAGYVGQIGGFKQGSSGVMSYELDAANHKGDGMKSFGDILGGLGSIGLNYGLSRNVAPGGGVGAAAPTYAAPTMSSGTLPFFARSQANPAAVPTMGVPFGASPSMAGTNNYRIF